MLVSPPQKGAGAVSSLPGVALLSSTFAPREDTRVKATGSLCQDILSREPNGEVTSDLSLLSELLEGLVRSAFGQHARLGALTSDLLDRLR